MHVILALTLNCFPLKLKEDPSLRYLQSPYLGFLQFVIINFVSFIFENLALVSNFFKFDGWCLLFKKVLSENNIFSFASLKRDGLTMVNF